MFGRDRPSSFTTARDSFPEDVLAQLGPMYGMAFRLTRNSADAEDLVQDTVVKALAAQARFQRGTNIKAWLFTILQNTWRNRRRDAVRDPLENDPAPVDDMTVGLNDVAVTPESLLVRATLDADLQHALDDLPEVFREAVWLRDVDEFSYAEIAEMLGVPIGTVMSRISRGRRQLYRRLTAQSATHSDLERPTGGRP